MTNSRKVIKVDLLREDLITNQPYYTIHETKNGGKMNYEALNDTHPFCEVKTKTYELCTYERVIGNVALDIPEEKFTQDFMICSEDIKHTFGFIDYVIRKEINMTTSHIAAIRADNRTLKKMNADLKMENKYLKLPWWKKLFGKKHGVVYDKT